MALSPDVKNNLIDCLRGRPQVYFAIPYGSAVECRPFRDLDIGPIARLIVHLYGQVDNRRVYQAIQHGLDDLAAHSRHTLPALTTKGDVACSNASA